MMNSTVNNIFQQVLEKIKPSEEDRLKLYKTYEYVKNKLSECLRNILWEKLADISLQGSVAKDTFLRGQSDIDVFLLFKPHVDIISSEWFENELIPLLLKCFSDYKCVLNYASHPYITVYINNIEVNIVPAFKVESPEKIISAVDRTPFHTEYVKTHLNEKQKDEVRLLKKFLRTWNIYGAEIEVQGFSGYLAELLIIAYGNLYNLLKNALSWRAFKTCIDIEGYYKSSKECLNNFKGSVLVVVDPVDPKRNAAAALSLKNFSLFKLLAKTFLEKPSVEFFLNEYEEKIDFEIVKKYIDYRLHNYDSCLYVLMFNVIKPIPDIIWGQLNRLKSSIVNTLKSQNLINDPYADVWVSQNFDKAALVLEVMHCSNIYKIHKGPYAFDTTNALLFMTKNRNSDIGPWIGDDGRLYVIKRLNPGTITKSATEVIKVTSLSGLKFENVIVVSSLKDLQCLENNYYYNDFIAWISKFLERKPLKKLLNLI
uniref:CCA-adding enzyme n=1 Tax=Ignisphaera aggregans TaxID=334771 RepID=A0A7C2V936_9CREN